MNRITLMIIAAALLALTPACDKKDGDATDGTSAEAQTTETETGAAAKADTEPADDAAEEMTPEAFAKAAPGNVCTWVTTCKNEEITVSISAMMGMVVGFGSMDRPDIQEKIKPINEAMKKEDRMVPNAQECGIMSGAAADLMGFSGKTLQAKIDGGKIEWDGAKAGECAAALKGDIDACQEEKKLEGDVKLAQLDKMMKAYEADLEAAFKPCEAMIVGKVADGEACDEDYECASGGKCQAKEPGKKDSPKVCQPAPEAAPADGAEEGGDEGAEAK